MISRLAAALLAGLVYVNALHNPFVYDDLRTVQRNPSIVPPVTLRGIVMHDVKRPIVNGSYAMDRAIWGPAPAGFHLTSIAVHMINVALLFQLAAMLLRARSPWPPFVAASLFAVHPMMTEAVGYISGRSELVCATFLLASLICAVCWMRGRGTRWAVWTVALWIPALLSKETAAMLPFLVFACDALTSDDDAGIRARTKRFHLPLIVFAAAAGLGRMLLLTQVEYPGNSAVQPALVPLAADVIVRYLRLMVVPSGQTLFHSVNAVPGIFAPRALLAFLVLVGMLAGAWTIRRSAGVVSFGLVSFLLLLAPPAALTIMNSGEPMAEHRVYIASIGLFLAAGSVFQWLTARAAQLTRYGAEAVATMAALVLLSFSLETLVRNAVWSDPVALWKESADLAPYHPRPRMLLGEALEDAGRRPEALAEYEAAVRLGPADPVAHLKLGLCLAGLGRYEPARAALRETLRLDPANEPAKRSLMLLDQIKPAT